MHVSKITVGEIKQLAGVFDDGGRLPGLTPVAQKSPIIESKNECKYRERANTLPRDLRASSVDALLKYRQQGSLVSPVSDRPGGQSRGKHGIQELLVRSFRWLEADMHTQGTNGLGMHPLSSVYSLIDCSKIASKGSQWIAASLSLSERRQVPFNLLQVALRCLTGFRQFIDLQLDLRSVIVNLLERAFRERHLSFDLVKYLLTSRLLLRQLGSALLKSFMAVLLHLFVSCLLHVAYQGLLTFNFVPQVSQVNLGQQDGIKRLVVSRQNI